MSWLSDRVVNHLRRVTELPDLSETKYRCLEKIATGGMGTVYLAEDTQLQRQIALKILTLSDQPGELANRLMREARIIAALEHPGIVPIHDVGSLPDGRVFYTMKLVKGHRLDEHVRQISSLPELLRLFQKICEAVAFAHSRQIIHRDLKPENIMVGDFGEVLVMDWGLAKVLLPNRQPLTSTGHPGGAEKDSPRLKNSRTTEHGTVLGTPAYMAPEQARGEIDQLDERTDVYALGAIIYFLLTGSHPMASGSKGAEHSESPPIRPRKKNPKIPKPMEAIYFKAIAPDKTARYESACHLSADIERFLNGQPVSSYRESVFETLGRWISKNKFVVALLLVYLIVRFLIYFLSKL
jgi:serine/threonine protein kinase